MNRVNKILLIFVFLICIFNASQNIYAEVYGSISGNVYDEKLGKGMEGVAVGLTDLSGNYRIKVKGRIDAFSSVTDRNGNYVINMVPPGTYKMVLIDTFESKITFRKDPKQIEKQVILEPGKNLVNVNFRIKRLGIIYGQVYDTDGIT
ncbi:carboxypeptidase regulatory-like domain-containing protein, partial [Candidatus Desantisbacteria bacterium]|nr:carboxypeptidase regulatory-like domain-containing protein [Candidatus Desantisbacteria bacterium]